MFGVLGLGFLLGMQHALEADHIAAVSSLAARRTDISDIVKHGLTWGLGHTLTLFVFAGAAILLGHAIPATKSRGSRRHHAGRPRRPRAVEAVARPRAFSPPQPWRRHGSRPRPQPRQGEIKASRAACSRAARTCPWFSLAHAA